MLNRLKLSHRFTILIALFTFGFLFYGAWSFKTLDELKVNGPVYQRITQGKDLIADILPPPEYIIESYLLSLQLRDATDRGEQEGLIGRLQTLKKEYDTRHAYWEKEALEAELAAAFLAEAHKPALAFYTTAFDDFIPAIQGGDASGASAALASMKTAYETHRAAIDRVVQLTVKRNAADEAEANARIQSATVLSLLIFCVSLVSSFAVATIICRQLIRGLGGEPDYAVNVAGRIAAGDLTTRIEVKDGDRDSLLYAMKTMQETLAEAVSGIKSAVDSVSTGAQQIAVGNSDLSQRTVEQSASLENSSASMEALVVTVRQNSENSRQANLAAQSASEVALRGGEVVADVVQTMGSINASSKRIVDIIDVIDGIAFQTNILALNAAVEAARAGAQGAGFAVVAAEVRNLAQRSAAAAKEIKGLIDDSVHKVEVGARLVDQAGSTMEEIVNSVRRVTGIINEISAASDEQIGGIEQIRKSIEIMDEMTQQNAALVEQAAAAAGSLENQAVLLAQTVRTFQLDHQVPVCEARHAVPLLTAE